MQPNLPSQTTDLIRVRRCLQNDRLAQREVYEMLADKMFAVCLRYTGDRETARDVLHDGFITLFSRMDTFKGEGSFEGWARRIFVTTALMHLRKSDILKRTEELESPAAARLQAPESSAGPLEAAELLKLIARMPAGFRTVFNLYAIEGYSHQEIAKALNISEGGSRSQLSRARLWLQERLEKDLPAKNRPATGG